MNRKAYIALFLIFLVVLGVLLWFGQSYEPAVVNSTPENMGALTTPALALVTPIPQPLHMYLISGGSSSIKVWQFNQDAMWSKKYDVTTTLDDVDTLFAAAEKELQFFGGDFLTNTELSLATYITSYRLSPDLEQLAYTREAGYCAEDIFRCYGLNQLVNLNLVTGQSDVLFQTPIYNNGISSVVWSHDSRYVAAEHWRSDAPNQTVVFDTIDNSLAMSLDDALPLEWFFNDNVLILSQQNYGTLDVQGRLQFCSVGSPNCQEIWLGDVGVVPRGLDINPDGDRLVFAAGTANRANLDLYLFSRDTEITEKIPVGFRRVLKTPRWSPDGQLIAAEHEDRTGGGYTVSFMVIEPASGQIVSEHPLKNFNNRWWQWGMESKALWILGGDPRFGYFLQTFDVTNGAIQDVSLPPLGPDEWLGLREIDSGVWYRQH